MSSTSKNGRFCWYELMTTDPQAAKGFYGKVIGWSTEDWLQAPMPYTILKSEGGPIGGLMELPDEAKATGVPPNWMAYIEVDDIVSALKKAVELGGRIEKEATRIARAGTFAIVSDPQGATFVMWEAAPDAAATFTEQPGAADFSWHELAATDHEAAWGFYEALFGWHKTEAVDMGEMGTYQLFGRGDLPLGGMFNKPGERASPSFWLYYIRVENVPAAVERVKANGGQVLNGPMEVPGGDLIAQCLDPQGAAFALHSSKN